MWSTDLKSIRLTNLTSFPLCATPPSFPFALTHLCLRSVFNHSGPVLSALLQPSLTSLTIDLRDVVGGSRPQWMDPTLNAALLDIAPQLEALSVSLSLPNTDLASELAPLLAACTGLKQLHLVVRLVEVRMNEWISRRRQLARSGQATLDLLWEMWDPEPGIALEKLEELVLEDWTRKELEWPERGRRVLDVCEARGVRVSFRPRAVECEYFFRRRLL